MLRSDNLMVVMRPATIEEVKQEIERYLDVAPALSYIWSDVTCKQINNDLGTNLVSCDEDPPPPPFDDCDLIVVAEPIHPIDIENFQLEYETGLGGSEWACKIMFTETPLPPREPKKLCHYPPFGDWKNIK